MVSFKNGISVVFLSSVLSACGSGGGGGGSSSGGGFIDPANCVLPTDMAAITSSNAELITSEVIAAVQTVLAFADTSGSFIEFNEAAIVTNPEVFNCLVAGTITITYTDTDTSSAVSAGDSLTAQFANCDLMPEVINGIFETRINTVTGANAGAAASANDWNFNISGNTNNLMVNDSNINAAADADSIADVDFIFAGGILAATATSNTLTASDNSGQCVQVQNALIDSEASNVTTNPASYSVALNQAGNMTVASTEISGFVEIPQLSSVFNGMENFIDPGTGDYGQYFAALDNPDTGSLEINGLNSSTASVTVSAGGNVQIDVDEDGDTVVDNIIMTTWTAL